MIIESVQYPILDSESFVAEFFKNLFAVTGAVGTATSHDVDVNTMVYMVPTYTRN